MKKRIFSMLLVCLVVLSSLAVMASATNIEPRRGSAYVTGYLSDGTYCDGLIQNRDGFNVQTGASRQVDSLSVRFLGGRYRDVNGVEHSTSARNAVSKTNTDHVTATYGPSNITIINGAGAHIVQDVGNMSWNANSNFS